jgi:hypothetical protein
MRRILGVGAAAALALMAGTAVADEVTGAIENIDLTAMTFEVGGKTFAASPENTVGVKLDELMDGDEVKVVYTEETSGDDPINAMELMKAE